MSIDGVRHDYPEMHQMKNLIEIAKMGTSAKGLIPVFPSKTFPNHYSIVTGLYPKNHRIIENNFYDPKMKKAYSPNDPFTVNDGKWYGGIPLWVLAEKQGLRSASYFWVGSEAEIQGKRPSYYYPFAPLSSNDAEIQQVLKWAQLPFEKRPGFITLYFPMVDNAGHEFGPEAEQTKSAAQEADRLIGSLWKGLRETQVPFILVIVSDHGMSKLASDKRIQLSDYIDPETFEIQGSGSFVTLSKKKNSNIKKALESLKKLEPTILVYENKNIPEHYRLRGSPQAGDIVLIAKLPWYIELPNKRKGVQNGSHGWDNNEKDMQGIFFAVGERVPVGRSLEAFENIHIYKWIADRLGLQIKSKIDGNDSLTKNLSLGNRPGH
jgi:predicted AlkP superfamily pyrophosphatase or phosphodiesterase